MTKRKTITRILIIALIALAVVIAVMAIVRVYENRYENYIDKIEVAYQDSNGIRTTNYVAILNQDVSWNASNADREGIAKYVIQAAVSKANSQQVRYFNVIGQTADRKMAFMFVQSKGVIRLYDENGKPTGDVPFS